MAIERISQYSQGGGRQYHQGHGGEPSSVRKFYEQAEGIVRDNPGYSVLATFAMGLGLGLAAAALLAPKDRRSAKMSDYLGENMRDAIQSAAARLVPDAVSRFLSKHS